MCLNQLQYLTHQSGTILPHQSSRRSRATHNPRAKAYNVSVPSHGSGRSRYTVHKNKIGAKHTPRPSLGTSDLRHHPTVIHASAQGEPPATKFGQLPQACLNVAGPRRAAKSARTCFRGRLMAQGFHGHRPIALLSANLPREPPRGQRQDASGQLSNFKLSTRVARYYCIGVNASPSPSRVGNHPAAR